MINMGVSAAQYAKDRVILFLQENFQRSKYQSAIGVRNMKNNPAFESIFPVHAIGKDMHGKLSPQ